jgi:hypothetical protein
MQAWPAIGRKRPYLRGVLSPALNFASSGWHHRTTEEKRISAQCELPHAGAMERGLNPSADVNRPRRNLYREWIATGQKVPCFGLL